VSVACVASAAVTFVSDAALALARAASRIELSVVTSEPAESFALLQSGDADLVIIDEYDYVPLALPDGVVAQELLREPMVLVSRTGALHDDRPRLADLADCTWVMPPTEAACGIAVRSACRAEGFEPRVLWETDDLLLLVRAVAAGHGVAVLPRLSIVGDRHDVEVRSLHGPGLERRLTAVARGSVLSRPVVTGVRDALVEAARAYAV
jgi:DNA-binding transcriptional LysR family regulator